MHGAPETVELAVMLVVGADPVRGTARLPSGEHRDFWGWLELAEIVQRIADGEQEPAPGR